MLAKTATLITFCNLLKFMAILVTVAMHICCLSASDAHVGHYERDLSQNDNHPKNIDTTTHRHRHHKSVRSRYDAHNRHLRDERGRLSKVEKDLEDKAEQKRDEIFLKSPVDNISRYGKIKEHKGKFDEEDSKRKTEPNFKINVPESNFEQEPKEKKTLKMVENHDPGRAISRPENKENVDVLSELSDESLPQSDKKKVSGLTSEKAEELKSSPEQNEVPVSSSENFEKPASHIEQNKTFEYTTEFSEEAMSQQLQTKDAETFSEPEDLMYTDASGEVHNVQGFFDDNSTTSIFPDNFESLTNTSHSEPESCQGCRLNKEKREAIREMRKRAIERQILNALGMEKPPNVTGWRYPKAPGFLNLYQKSESLMMNDAPIGGPRKKDHYYGEDVEWEDEPVRTKAVYIRAQAVPEELMLNISDGVFFTLPSQLYTSKIKRAHMWLYYNQPSSPSTQKYAELTISLIAPETKTSDRVVQKLLVTKKINIGKKRKPWRHIDIKKVLEFWMKRPELNLGLQLRALDSRGNNLVVLPPNEEYGPLVMVSLGRAKRHSRHRRSVATSCGENSQVRRCCRYPLTIGFAEMSMEWIIAPTSVEANYCSGECYMAMMDATPRSWFASHMDVGIGSCCVPTRMQPLSLLYFGEDGSVLYQILQDVKVITCGCM